MKRISPARLRELLRYDGETGKLFWLPRTAAHFAHTDRPAVRATLWNRQWAQREALFGIGNHGYPTGSIFNRQYLAHRVIWAIVRGRWPSGEIDHMDGCRTNNRIANLRCVPRTLNMRNRRLSSANRSGAMGVYWAPHAGKWRAEIKCGNRTHLGYFSDKRLAIAARKEAERENGFHSNHGRAA